MLEAVKRAIPLSTDAYDEEIRDLIKDAKADLLLTGNVMAREENFPLIRRALKTYCKMNFGTPDNYEQLKRSYDEQKAQMMSATGFTDWGDGDGQI